MKSYKYRIKNSKGFEIKTNDLKTAIHYAKEIFDNEVEYIKPFIIICIDKWHKDIRKYIPFGDFTNEGFKEY